MKKQIITITMLTFTCMTIFAQENIGEIGADVAQQNLEEISLLKFEDAGMWHVKNIHGTTQVTLRLRENQPMNKEEIAENKQDLNISEQDSYVLGVKIHFLRRAITTVDIMLNRPLAVPGIAKQLSLQVAGRNHRHRLFFLIEDNQGKKYTLEAEGNRQGQLNFRGWRKLAVSIPGPNIVQQEDLYDENNTGIKILGLRILPELTEMYGDYYVYFDDLRAYTNLYQIETRDPDDPNDNWGT